jgi:hypothetical protein
MLEITGEDISGLNDTDLRSLIGLLCEADLREQGIPTAGVTWGGHQNAKDGGIDVRVELNSTPVEDGFIPRSNTGFQVKKPDMPRAAILEEMKPNGELREVIKDLIRIKGVYIIVSSQGSTADLALVSRKGAMREALSGYQNHLDLMIDFYDRERIAGWVRQHPSLVLWVRKKMGKPLQGWQPFDNWARCPNGIEEKYIMDEHIRMQSSFNQGSDGFSVTEGINKVRNLMNKPASSVRLVGLSGVGKTRLLQALFDERIGENPLNKDLVYYTDISNSPIPDPRSFAEQVLALRKPAILAIDNCPPQLHSSLTKICSEPGSFVSLITVEYDVREDQPEETEVIRLEPSSTELIEKVILSRFDYISEVSARSIAEFSGGNARIAITLANTVKRGENLSAFKDEELFNRLFLQRNDPSNSLMKAAEVCSLVYSFNIHTSSDDEMELKLLSSLAEMSERELYRNVQELKQRDLVQQRSVWRAVLPHAIANKLAERALRNIPIDEICRVFEDGGSTRLLKAFSRRLGYLHDCEEASDIVKRWLMDEGMLGDISNLNDLGLSMFTNIAPINPESVLIAFEKIAVSNYSTQFFSRENPHYSEFTRVLRSIAYDKQFFERSTSLLCQFALSEKPDENYNSIRSLLKSLFQLYLSGTHASAEQRLNVIRKLIESDSEVENELGIALLETTLQTLGFSSFYEFEFGARPRDYGFSPLSTSEIQNWYRVFTEYTGSVSSSKSRIAMQARELLARSFSSLWIKIGMYNELEIVVERILEHGSWNDGWIAVKSMKKLNGNLMKSDIVTRVNKMEENLKPTTLADKALTFILGDKLNLVNLVENNGDDEYSEIDRITKQLGKEVGLSISTFKEVLPQLVRIRETWSTLHSFGQGLAEGSIYPEKTWIEFCNQLSYIDESERDYEVLKGFLFRIAKIDIQISEKILSEVVTNDILASVYPLLEVSVGIGPQGIERLKKSLEYSVAPIWTYKSIAYGQINDENLADLLKIICLKLNGVEVAIEILSMRLHGHSKEKALSDIIISLGQELISKYSYENGNNRNAMDYKLAVIIKACLTDASVEEIKKNFFRKMITLSANYNFSFSNNNEVLKALAVKFPLTILDTLIEELDHTNHVMKTTALTQSSVLSYIDDETIIKWTNVEKSIRIPKVVSMLNSYQKSKESGLLEWKSLPLRLIENSDAPAIVLNELRKRFYPMSWSGSLANTLETRLPLLCELKKHGDQRVVDWAMKEEKVLTETIILERERERNEERSRNERFE